jgi:metal-responsive CopG/Arc/MetJ family transcriptional regulator
MKNTKKVTTIRLDENLLAEIDETAKTMGFTRTELIAMYMRLGMMRSVKKSGQDDKN